MSRWPVVVWTGATLAVLVSASALAQIRPRISVDASTVAINGRPAVRFQASNGSLSPAERAQITAGRLQALAAQGIDPYRVVAKGDRGQARVMAGETLICIATAADARAGRTTADALAASWATNIRTLLLMPPVALGARELLVPLGENRRVDVGGAAIGPIYVRVDNPEVAAAAAGADGRYVQVSGKQVGNTSIEVVVEGERAFLPVMVRKYAGAAPLLVTASVTGNPCPASFVTHAARQAVVHSTVAEPGARVEVGAVEGTDGPLAPDQKRTLKVGVRVSGEGYIPFATQAVVEVANVQMPRETVDQLFYSNDPERLLKYQTLFAGRVEPNVPTRLLYHHQNMIGKRVHLIVEVINPNAYPASLRVIKGISSPHIDTVMVGHVAGLAFLRDYQHNVSIIEPIPPESRLVLVSDMLNHQQTASGILQVRAMDGGPVYLRVTAAEPHVDNVVVGTIAPAPSMMALQLSDHIYPSPSKMLEAAYRVGERWAFIPIGRHALDDTAAQKKLYGNYGVTYDVNLQIENPTSAKKKVSVLFEASAGLASGVFLIDGKFVMAKYAKPPNEVPLASYDLSPGESRTVRIVTVPLAGSNYPATLVVRS